MDTWIKVREVFYFLIICILLFIFLIWSKQDVFYFAASSPTEAQSDVMVTDGP